MTTTDIPRYHPVSPRCGTVLDEPQGFEAVPAKEPEAATVWRRSPEGEGIGGAQAPQEPEGQEQTKPQAAEASGEMGTKE